MAEKSKLNKEEERLIGLSLSLGTVIGAMIEGPIGASIGTMAEIGI